MIDKKEIVIDEVVGVKTIINADRLMDLLRVDENEHEHDGAWI